MPRPKNKQRLILRLPSKACDRAGFSPKLQALGFAQSTRARQRRVHRRRSHTELRRLCFDIAPHGELAECDAAYRADRSDRSAKTLFKRRLFAVVLRDGEKVARLRRAGERHKIDLIATKRVDQP